jgi:hypothetical protein
VAKRFIILITCILNYFLATGDEVKFTLVLSSQSISFQDYLQVQYTIENSQKVSQFISPVFKGFNVVQGPDQASGWSLQNGVLKEYVSFSFLLKPTKEGHIMIPSATVKVDGRSYHSNNAWVDVASSVFHGQAEDRSLVNEFILKKGEGIEKKIHNNIFIKLDVNKYSCYEGEPLVATYKLYTRLKSESKVTKRPSFNGFSVYDMANPETEEAGREIYKGREYNVYLLRKVQLYPLQSGRFELEPVEVENSLTLIKAENIGNDNGLTDIIRALAEDNNKHEGIIREKVTLASNPVTVNVKALPENKHLSFNGAVGQFRLRSSVPGGIIRKNDVVNLKIEVSGKGNFPMLPPPAIKWPDSIEAFESSVNEQFNRFVSPISGSKIFTLPFSVKKEGDIIIPAVTLYYFDPENAKYSSVSTDSILLHIEPEIRQSAKLTGAVLQQSPVNTWKWIIYGLGLIIVFGGLYLILLQYGVKKPKLSYKPVTDKEELKTPFSESEAVEDPVLIIKNAFEQNDYQQFYSQLNRVLDEWMMKKYRADASGNWQQALLQNGVDAKLIDQIESLKKDAELAMYTPFVMDSKMIEDLNAIQQIIGKRN